MARNTRSSTGETRPVVARLAPTRKAARPEPPTGMSVTFHPAVLHSRVRHRGDPGLVIPYIGRNDLTEK